MKAIKYAGLAALVAGISCSSGETKGVLKDYVQARNLCSVCSVEEKPCSFMTQECETADSDSVAQLTPENFDAIVLENKLPVVVKFYADWCGPCRGYKPIFEKVCAEYGGKLVCGAYNTDQDNFEDTNAISLRYGVRGIPATRFFHGGAELENKRFSGGRPEEILRALFDDFLKECGH